MPLRIVIVGGGSARWMCLRPAAQVLHPERYRLTLIESDRSARSAWAKPPAGAARLQRVAGPGRSAVRRETQARSSSASSSATGTCREVTSIHSVRSANSGVAWSSSISGCARVARDSIRRHSRNSRSRCACRRNAFDFPSPSTVLSTFYGFAYHFDATLYADFLRRWSMARGVTYRRPGGRRRAGWRAGHIESLTLKSGQRIAGDFFIDCSGFRSLLLGDKLQVPWEDWARGCLRSRLGGALRALRRLHALHALDRRRKAAAGPGAFPCSIARAMATCSRRVT